MLELPLLPLLLLYQALLLRLLEPELREAEPDDEDPVLPLTTVDELLL